nr:hypothetical protein [Microcystis aeruginosa]
MRRSDRILRQSFRN